MLQIFNYCFSLPQRSLLSPSPSETLSSLSLSSLGLGVEGKQGVAFKSKKLSCYISELYFFLEMKPLYVWLMRKRRKAEEK
jgi:hypothetical protein